MYMLSYPIFFFQAEDGIRDLTVTGVQTCALPISVLLAPPPCAPAFAQGGGASSTGTIQGRVADAQGAVLPGEIGRASCRERVESPVVSVVLKNEGWLRVATVGILGDR